MLKVNLILGSMVVFILQGCLFSEPKPLPTPIPTPKPPKEVQEPKVPVLEPKRVGIGIQKGRVEKFSKTPYGLYYYGQILIEPELMQEALRGPEAQNFFDHIFNLLGEKKKSFGLSVTPIIDNHTLPPIVLFTYDYDSNAKEWKTYFNEEPKTKMTLLQADTSLSFEFNYISIDGTTFNQIKNLTKEIYGDSIVLLGTSLPYIDLITDRVSRLLSESVGSSTTLYFRPVADAKKSVSYTIKTKTDKTLAKVKFSLLLRDSVISHTLRESELNTIPKVNTYTNPLNAVYTNLNHNFTLNDQLQKDEAIATFFQIQNPAQFRNKCRNILNKLETYKLNIFDRYNAFSQILEATDFLRKESLFNSGCLSPRKLDLLQKMGIYFVAPKTALVHIDIGDEHLTNLGRYMLNPVANVGYKNDLLKLFSKTLIVQSNGLIDFEGFHSENAEAIMSPEQFMKALANVGVARFGMYNEYRKEFAQFFFRPLRSKTIYRIKLNREKEWGRIRSVLIEPWLDENIPLTKQKELRTAADIRVLNYQTDVLRNP